MKSVTFNWITSSRIEINKKIDTVFKQLIHGKPFNPLPKYKFLDVTKFKAFADDKLNVAKMAIFLFDRAENTVGIEENAAYQHFFLFPQFFSKVFFFGVVKIQDCVVKS